MKTIKDYIQESKHSFRIKSHLKKQVYNYHPESKSELADIINELLQRGETNLNYIDVSKVKDFVNLFAIVKIRYHDNLPNVDVSEWNISDDAKIQALFKNFKNFNGDLSLWDMSKRKSLAYMFYGCELFTGKGLENWDISNVNSCSHMFGECKTFNADISKWDVSNLKNTGYMFFCCTNFNQDLSGWNIPGVCWKQSMFEGCKKFKCNLDNWDPTDKESCRNIFKGCPGMQRSGRPKWYK